MLVFIDPDVGDPGRNRIGRGGLLPAVAFAEVGGTGAGSGGMAGRKRLAAAVRTRAPVAILERVLQRLGGGDRDGDFAAELPETAVVALVGRIGRSTGGGDKFQLVRQFQLVAIGFGMAEA